MVTKPRRRSVYLQSRRQRRHVQLDPVAEQKRSEVVKPSKQSIIRQLKDALWEGAAITSILWNYRPKDWVTNVHAVDFDNDGDIEVLLSSRDGIVRVHTPWGAKKWECKFEEHEISAMFAIPVSDITSQKRTVQSQPCVIVGMRDGNVYAIDQNGKKVPEWNYNTGRMIRQIYASNDMPNRIIIGSEDRCIHIIDRNTGKELVPPYKTQGWVRSVFARDMDNDGRDEILAGSGDKCLYILDSQGRFLDKMFLGHQIYALFAAHFKEGGPITVVTSSNRKDLFVWTVKRCADGRWVQSKEWESSTEHPLFGNRVHSIFVEDINNDHEPEIILGAEDGFLYILNMQGQLLWRRNLANCIYSIWVMDINFDGQKEILIGTENKGVYVIQVQINEDITERIRNVYNDMLLDEKPGSVDRALKSLTPREKATLKDFVDERPPLRPVQMEVEKATQLMQEGQYEQALHLFLHARQQRVQHYWSQPVTTRGYIWTLGIGQVEQRGKYDLIVGTDEGYIYAIDVKRGAERYIWEKDVQDRVRMLQIAELHSGELDSIAAVLANHRMVILNSQGEMIKEHIFQQEEDWARCLHVEVPHNDPVRDTEILLGLENNKIAIWDAEMQKEQKVIHTPQGISILSTYDLNNSGRAEIISGSINDHVYVYDHDGQLLWQFQTQDHILALLAEDIDRDGHAEIIVGSEDRYVYVLDHEGHLKWRYRTIRGVSDVAVCDIRLESEPENPSERKLKILVGSSDGYLYILNAFGDLLWKYKSPNRIKAVRARDITGDGKVEIALASENHLELLQIVNQKKLFNDAQECWEKLMSTKKDSHSGLLELTHHSNELIRAYALVRLSGTYQREEEDIKRLQEALRDEESPEVKKELVRAIINLHMVPTNKEDNTRQAHNFLRQLAADPDPDIRLAIITILPKLLEYNERLCFQYLEYFTHNVDPWVRRAVIRQLDALAEKNDERVFSLLLNTIHDTDDWIRDETGRALAHYFDAHPEHTIRDTFRLLQIRASVPVLQQISYSARKPAIKQWFNTITNGLTNFDKQVVPAYIDEMLVAIDGLLPYTPLYGDDYRQVYAEFHRLNLIHSSSAIARYKWYNTTEEHPEEYYSTIRICMETFSHINDIADIIRALEHREEVRDRMTSLINATDKIESIRTALLQQELEERAAHPRDYHIPEFIVLFTLLEQQYQIIKTEIYRLRGNARLVAEIRNKEAQREEEVVVSLLITNKGVSTADHVIVDMDTNDHDYSLVGPHSQRLQQVANNNTATVAFTIKPHSSAPRLKFKITYDDAEKRGKQEQFADVVLLQDKQRPYVEIPNPYTSGTPIRERKMFYGRTNDIDTLRTKLSSVTANKVVVLSGQRRMGKTSLVYQLSNELAKGSQVPVMIDLQGQTLQSMGHLLLGLAQRVKQEVQQRRGIALITPGRDEFIESPIDSFNTYLADTLSSLGNEKLVFLLDEFEILQEKINNGPLNQDVLHYLRSLMQHRDGLNFLLVGAPRIRHVTEPSWSVFFNIALHHMLDELKQSEAEALIKEPVRDFLEYDMLALDRMHQLSGDLPYFIHVLSEALITYCNTEHKSYVTINDINNVLDTVLEEQSGSIKWIWNQSTSPLERLLLSILAQDEGEEGRIFTHSDLYQEFERLGIPYEQEKVTAALQDLVREDIIEERLNGMQHRIPIGLVKEWLRKEKPPARVIRDEFPDSEI